jgi:hypothetical protein
MGMKKKILFTLLSRGDGNGLRKILLGAAVVGLLGIVGLVVLGVVAFKLVSGAMASRPDLDLLALEKLVSEQAVVLDASQQAAVRPLLTKLAAPELTEAERAALKQRLGTLLTPTQAAQVAQWKEATTQKAAEVAGLPAAITAWLDQLGLPATEARQGLDALLAWLQVRTPDNSAADLLRRLEQKPAQGS